MKYIKYIIMLIFVVYQIPWFQPPVPSTTQPLSTTLDCSDFYKMECREC